MKWKAELEQTNTCKSNITSYSTQSQIFSVYRYKIVLRATRAIVFCLLPLFLSAYTYAQSDIDEDAAPEVENVPFVDERGVNVVTGNIRIPGPSLSIGDPNAGGLSISYYATSLGQQHSLVGRVYRGEDTYTVKIGPHSEVFTRGFRPGVASGATLERVFSSDQFIYTMGDGTVAIFTRPALGQQIYAKDHYRIVSLSRPSGERLEWHYELIGPGNDLNQKAVELRSITNNFGYQLYFENNLRSVEVDGPLPGDPKVIKNIVSPIRVFAINNTVATCPTTSGVSCASSFGNAWPKLVFEVEQGQGYFDTKYRITDQSGGIWKYDPSATPTRAGVGQPLTKYYRLETPGNKVLEFIRLQTSPDCLGPLSNCNEVMHLPQRPVLTVTVNGTTWTYEHSSFFSYTTSSGESQYVTEMTVRDPLGNKTKFVGSVHRGVLYEVLDPLGNLTKYDWERPSLSTKGATPLLLRTTRPEGNYTSYAYDARGNLTQVTKVSKPGTGLANITVSSNYDSSCTNRVTCNRPNFTVNSRGGRIDYTYDPVHGGVLNTTLPAPTSGGQRPQTRNTYTAHSARYLNPLDGNLVNGSPIQLLSLSTTCPTSTTCDSSQEIRTSINYGATGNLSNLLPLSRSIGSASLSSVTQFGYDQIGNITSTDGPRVDVTDASHFTFDAHRRQILAIEPDPDGAGPLRRTATRNYYNSEGRITSVHLGDTTNSIGSDFGVLETLDYEYDVRGNLIKTISPTSIVQNSYDINGRLQCTATRMNPNVYSSLPLDACTPSSIGVNGQDRITQLNYDAAGRMTSEVRALGTTIQQTYMTLSYTPNGQREWVEDANGNRTVYTYDGFDRLWRTNFPSAIIGSHIANPNDYEQYSYDASGNRTGLRLRSGESIIYSFDALNRETLRNLPGGSALDVYFEYDLLGRRLSARHGSLSGQGIEYIYDALSRPLSETAYGRTITYQYDTASNRTRLVFPDTNYIQFTYDATNRMDQVRENGVSSGAGVLADYTYDSLGRQASIMRGGSTGARTEFFYDDASRLATLKQILGGSNNQLLGFAYNPANQIIQRTTTDNIHIWAPSSLNYSRNGLNQYTSVGAAPYSHDARGNLTSDGSQSFIYDFENRLTSVSGSTSLALAYDPLGRLRQTTSGSTVTQFVYAGDQLIAEYSGTGSMLRRYVHGAGIDEPLVSYNGPSLTNRIWLIADHQGSIISEHNGSSEVVRNRYGPYGEPQAWSGARFRYTGQIALPEIKLYHYKARVYNPSLGIFLQTDPVGYEDHMNLYAYVGNDPVNMVDPTGKTSTPFSMMRTDQRTREIARTDPAFASQATAYQGAGVAITAIAIAAVASPIGAVAVSIGVETGAIDSPVSIRGNAQRTTQGGVETTHANTSQRVANAEAQRPDAQSVHMNQTVSTITGGEVKSRVQPDVATLRTDGKIDVTEVLSGNQTRAQMEKKIRNALGSRCGTITCIDQD